MARRMRGPIEPSELSEQQLACIEQLVSGKTKAAAAEAVGVAAYTVSRWHREALFVAALNARRADLHEANAERLRSLASKALDVYQEALESADLGVRLKAAGMVLRAVRLAELPRVPTEIEPEQVEKSWRHEALLNSLM